jgi:DNA-binding NtrC family response regulator
LIVDDERQVREVIRDYLDSEGYDVCEADSAIAALAQVKERRPDVVLLDLNMPGAVRGEAIIAALRADHVPVIIISGEHDVELARRTLREGAFDYVKKPFDLVRLRELVEAAILLGQQ